MNPKHVRRILIAGVLLFAATFAAWRWRSMPSPVAAGPSGSNSAGSPPPPIDSSWPHPQASLTPPQVQAPDDWSARRVFIDAGHGAPNNSGNRSSFCLDEQDFTLRVATHLAQALKQDNLFETRLSRQGDERTGYRERVQAAEQWQAHAFISIHSDVRGQGEPWQPRPDTEPELSCLRSRTHPGFSVLWSDEADSLLASRRLGLARSIATALSALGLPAYDGRAYAGEYVAHHVTPGVFVDRHPTGKRIFVLRAPQMPAIIIETHHALDDREATRWEQPETLDAFAAAVKQGLLRALNK